MMLSRSIIRFISIPCILCCLVAWSPFSFLFSSAPTAPPGSTEWINQEMTKIQTQADNLDQDVLKLGLYAYVRARHQGLDDKQLLTIVDYTKSSNERRLWVVDLKKAKVLFNTWVTHGKNSGTDKAVSFSNNPGSLKSSLGVFLTTGAPYVGGNGYSLRLSGLEHGINDNAYERDIVIHGAWYASQSVAKKLGYLGRSWGCLAVDEKTVHPLINTIKDNTLVFVYYPDRQWLNNSNFLSG